MFSGRKVSSEARSQWLASAASAVLVDGTDQTPDDVAAALSAAHAAHAFLDGNQQALVVSVDRASRQVKLGADLSARMSAEPCVMFIKTCAGALPLEALSENVTMMTLPARPMQHLHSTLRNVYLPLLSSSNTASASDASATELVQQLDAALAKSLQQQLAASGGQHLSHISSPEDEV